MTFARTSPTFSVIVPTHERGSMVPTALRSIQEQTWTSWECIVVDDASTTPPELPDDPRFRLIRRQRNGGAGAARNTGIEAARGRYVTFLDDDDLYTPRRLELAAEAHARAPIVVGFLGSHDRPDELSGQKRRVLEGRVGDTILDAPIPSVGTTSIERAFVVPFDEGLRTTEDVEWWLRQAQVAPVTTVHEVLYLRRRHAMGRRDALSPTRLASLLQILDMHEAWMRAHPKAAAYHWKRAGGWARTLGRNREARRYFARSFRSQPSLRTVGSIARTIGRRS